MAQQKANEGTLGRIVDGQGNDADLAVLEATDHLEQLPHAFSRNTGELTNRG